MVLGLGSWEIVFVGLALLILFGPEHAPQAIRKAGQMQARLQRALEHLDHAIQQDSDDSSESDEPVPTSRETFPSSPESDDQN